MSKIGSFEFEMEKLARMVITVCHKRRDLFFRDESRSSRLEMVKQHVENFFDVKVQNEKFLELAKFFPAVFQIDDLGGKPFPFYTLVIDREQADILEVW